MNAPQHRQAVARHRRPIRERRCSFMQAGRAVLRGRRTRWRTPIATLLRESTARKRCKTVRRLCSATRPTCNAVRRACKTALRACKTDVQARMLASQARRTDPSAAVPRDLFVHTPHSRASTRVRAFSATFSRKLVRWCGAIVAALVKRRSRAPWMDAEAPARSPPARRASAQARRM